MAALGCVNLPGFSLGCGCCANRGVTAMGERCDRGILLSTGECSLTVRGTAKAGVHFLCKCIWRVCGAKTQGSGGAM